MSKHLCAYLERGNMNDIKQNRIAAPVLIIYCILFWQKKDSARAQMRDKESFMQ